MRQITIELPDEIAQQAEREAASRNLRVEDYISQNVAQLLVRLTDFEDILRKVIDEDRELLEQIIDDNEELYRRLAGGS